MWTTVPTIPQKTLHMISIHKDNKITKRELKDWALNKNLIQVGKKDTLDMEERKDKLHTWL
jgi:hypothetical protein